MREGHRANALLVELLLVILFFMLGASVLVQVFASSRHKSIQARATNLALTEAQNLAEDLYASDDPEGFLKNAGYTSEDGKWNYQAEKFQLTVTRVETPENEKTEAGELRMYMITATGDGVELFTLPSTRYIPKEVSP